MAKVYTGRDGVMQLAGVTLAKVSSFSLQSDLETLETTTLSENIRSYTVELTFRWVDGADNNDIKLTAYITSATIGASTGEIVSVSISFVGTGALATATIS